MTRDATTSGTDPGAPVSGEVAHGPQTGGLTALRRNGEPLYRQLADDLRTRILAGEFPVPDAMPTEAEVLNLSQESAGHGR